MSSPSQYEQVVSGGSARGGVGPSPSLYGADTDHEMADLTSSDFDRVRREPQTPEEKLRHAGTTCLEKHPCPTCCSVFSVSGMVFLIWVWSYLSSDSPYLVLEDETLEKTELAGSVLWGAVLYMLTLGYSAVAYKYQEGLRSR